MSDNCYSVYRHTCPNGKIYIGITQQKPTRRWRNGLGYRGNPHFWNAIQKYGWENIRHEILFEKLSKECACEKEKELIEEYNATNRLFGYNEKTGGQIGVTFSDSMRRKMGEAKKGWSAPRTKEWTDRISKSIKQTLSDQTIREKYANRARELGEKNSRPVYQIDENLNILSVYCSINEAGRKTGIPCGNISSCCRGRYKTAGGFKWRYATDHSGREAAL